jgi:glycosyltransferase involved in cell wall biosynthesis
MRAAATLRALAQTARVTLLIAPGADAPYTPLARELRAHCERVVHLGLGETLLPRRHFDVVHLFRLAALAAAEPWLRRAAAVHLDLDDLESVSNRRLATLAWASGKETAAHRAEDAAERTGFLENDALARFARVYVCSETARQTLLKRHAAGAEVVVLPNRLPLPVTTPFLPPSGNTFTLLFVGTLDDEANEDAMHFFCAGILPFIQAGADRPVTLRIVGAGAGPTVQRLDSQAGVEVIGEVADVAPWYRDAHVAIAPLRAGAGCRIKVLEAFAQQRPVVATRIGIDGIAAEDGRHALIADDPGTFATACLRFLHEPELSARIAQEAFQLFEERYAEGD